MLKRFVAFILCTLMLLACGGCKNHEEVASTTSDATEKSTPTSTPMSTLTPTPTVEPTPTLTPFPTPAPEEQLEEILSNQYASWEEAYGYFFENNPYKEERCRYHLVDLDFDDTPELLVGHNMGSGLFSLLEDAFTFKNGEMIKLNYGENVELSFGTYEIYVDKNNKRHIVCEYFCRLSPEEYRTKDVEMIFADNTISVEELFKVEEKYDQSVGDMVFTYYRNISGNMTQISESSYENRMNIYYPDWNKEGECKLGRDGCAGDSVFDITELLNSYNSSQLD
ncbi:MAG: hypothetical protein E7413_05795 [Ruminococcaceae bacterium]|nr:hypothetical protein [Oscillospiraceae bacterium]